MILTPSVSNRTDLEKRKEIVELLPCSASVKEHAAGLEHRSYKANSKVVVWKIERIEPAGDRCAT